MVKLTSSDGQLFEIEEVYAAESQMIKNMVEGESPARSETFPNAGFILPHRIVSTIGSTGLAS